MIAPRIARQSFRPAVRKLCGFLRAWADGPGRISIERDPTKHDSERQIAIVRPRRSLHPSFTDGRVLLIDATGNLDHVRQLLPDAVEIAPPLPVAPHQTIVHFQMVSAGKRAMRRPGNKAYHMALAALYAGDGDGLITHKEHEARLRRNCDYPTRTLLRAHRQARLGEMLDRARLRPAVAVAEGRGQPRRCTDRRSH